ncbi:hypothetical protein BH11ACT6_BH11ACT6_03710 [soil metagenome]
MNTIPAYAAEALGPGVVLLRDGAILDAIYLVQTGIANTNSNSRSIPRFQALQRQLMRAHQMAGERHVDVHAVDALSESIVCEDEASAAITIDEASSLLGLSRRHVYRLAPTLGRRRGGRWFLSRRLVLALKDQRQQEENNP